MKNDMDLLKKSIKETDIVHAILEYLHAVKITAWRANTGALQRKSKGGHDYYCRFGFPGMPDIIGYLKCKDKCLSEFIEAEDMACKTVPLFIEVKKPGAKINNKNQIDFINKAKKDGCFAMFAFSADEVERELKELKFI